VWLSGVATDPELPLPARYRRTSLPSRRSDTVKIRWADAEEKTEHDEREIERLRAQVEKLNRMLYGTRSEKLRRQVEQAQALLKQREQENDRHSGREDDPAVPRQLRQSRHCRPLPKQLSRGKAFFLTLTHKYNLFI